MRLWHKDLLAFLSSSQLLDQWRECCTIAGLLAKEHTPDNYLVNRITDYDPEHFNRYVSLVIEQLRIRNCSISEATMDRFDRDFRAWKSYVQSLLPYEIDSVVVTPDHLFEGWHNARYLKQCYYNLQEKFDCGAIQEKDWDCIIHGYVTLGGPMK